VYILEKYHGGYKMKSLKTFSYWALFSILLSVAIFVGCNITNGTGTVNLNLADAPIADSKDIEGVYITIESIEYNINDKWVVADDFVGPQKFNLLELTGGTVAPIADTQISAGTVTQIRFMLSAPEKGEQVKGTPGCYIAIDPDGTADGEEGDDVIEALFVPSGGETGYKANGPFEVPANGTVEITADFDVRKSVIYTGNREIGGGFYLLKPTIKLVVNNQAGSIQGAFVDNTTDAYDTYVIFAYEDDMYDPSEATAVDAQSEPFPNAVGSGTAVDSDEDNVLDAYTIAFLPAGTYDLIVAGVDAEGNYTVVSETDYADVAVESEKTTIQNIDLSN
jgi:hypothetical protein